MAGYTTIQIGGQQVGLRFGVAALSIAAKKKAIKIIDGVLETPDTISTAHYLHAAYIDNCYTKEINADIPFEKFVEWTEEQYISGEEGVKELMRVTDTISQSTFVKPREKTPEEIEKEEKEGKKKAPLTKLIGTKSKRSA